MSKTVYTVSGSATKRPESLPDGLVVQEVKIPHDKLELSTMGGNRFTIQEEPKTSYNPARIKMTAYGAIDNRERFFTMAQAAEIGRWLLEVGVSHGAVLRQVETSTGVWYEVEPNWFVTADSREDAFDISRGEDRTEFGYDSLEGLLKTYPSGKVING